MLVVVEHRGVGASGQAGGPSGAAEGGYGSGRAGQ